MVFLGGHSVKYQLPSIVCELCVQECACVCVLLCRVFDIAAHLVYYFSPVIAANQLKEHSHEKIHMFFGPIPQKIINKKHFQYTLSQNYL